VVTSFAVRAIALIERAAAIPALKFFTSSTTAFLMSLRTASYLELKTLIPKIGHWLGIKMR
jgi:hypothetical protein